jgi:hypothetical protein
MARTVAAPCTKHRQPGIAIARRTGRSGPWQVICERDELGDDPIDVAPLAAFAPPDDPGFVALEVELLRRICAVRPHRPTGLPNRPQAGS